MTELNDYGLPVRQRDRMDSDVDVETAAQQEQARRILARRRLLPFILRNDPEFDAAMFHKLVTWRLEKFSEQVANGESPRLIIQAPPRHGKLMADDTPVLTTEGWKTHGGLQIGDYVYHPSGKPVAVLAVSEKQPADWRVDVSSGESFYCHGRHEWTVYDRRYAEPVTIETRQFRQHITEVDYQLPFSLGLGLVDDHRVLTVAAVEHDPRGKFGHCIQVDSEDGLYLVGKTLVPTHNSELVSRNFPAWHLGRYPDHEFIACSYGSDLARDFSRKVRGLLLDEGYQALFPDVELDPDSRAVDRWNIDGHRGGYVAAGVGGPITGRGMHCVTGDTLVSTESGDIRMDTLVRLVDPPRVWSYNEISRANELKAIKAGQLTYDDRLYVVETVSGRAVTVTGEHRFFVSGRGYVEAKNLRTSDVLVATERQKRVHSLPGLRNAEEAEVDQTNLSSLLFQATESLYKCEMPLLPGEFREASVRGTEGAGSRAYSRLLLGDLLKATPRDQECEEVRAMRDSYARSRSRQILQPRMSGGRKTAAQQDADDQRVPTMWHGVSATILQNEILWEDVRGPISQRPYVWDREQSLQARRILHESLSGHQTNDSGSRWQEVRYVWDRRASAEDAGSRRDADEFGGTSHRPRPAEQSTDEPDYALRTMSSVAPPLRGDTVSLVRCIDVDPFPVFDIQVEDNENFYANGILTHNCGVIDDYVKNWEEADNESSREKLWNWYESTFKSRLAPGAGIIIMATRWHHDDLIGRVIEQDGDAKDGGDWDVMSFSAIAEADEYTDDGELFRHAGEALHAARYPVEFFDQFKKNPRVYWSLYQQKPMVEGGNFFKEEAFKWYRSVERPELEDLTIISTWDFAVGQKEQNDFTVGCVGGIDRNFKVWALDQVRGHWDSMETVEKIIEIYRLWQPDMWGFEHGQISLAIAPFLNRRMVEESIWDIDIEDSAMKTGRRDKVARAKPLQGFIRTGHFLFPSEAEWKKTMMDEFLVFPAGEHDDQVDAWAWMAQRAEDFISKGVVPKKSRPRGRYEKVPWRERLSRELAGQSGGSWRTA